MSPIWLGPSAVTPAQVRRLPVTDDPDTPVQRVTVPLVPSAVAVPRQADQADLQLAALQQEDEQLPAGLSDVHPA